LKNNNKKIKADIAVVEAGLAQDLEHARSMISCGLIFVGDKVVSPGTSINEQELSEHGFRIKDHKQNVSRGGVKLGSVFSAVNIDVDGMTCIDVGASTGGFTELLLRKGARVVYAVDVGKNILDYKLRTDDRVVVMEGVNARLLDENEKVKERISPESLDIAVFDLSFISLRLVVPKVLPYIKKGGILIPLIKPQFEAELEEIERGGVVRSPDVIKRIIQTMSGFLKDLGLVVKEIIPSKIKGPSGNQEYFFVCFKE